MCLSVKYFFVSSSVKMISVKVLLQQWDLPLKIKISLNGNDRVNEKYGANHMLDMFSDNEWSFGGLNTDVRN